MTKKLVEKHFYSKTFFPKKTLGIPQNDEKIVKKYAGKRLKCTKKITRKKITRRGFRAIAFGCYIKTITRKKITRAAIWCARAVFAMEISSVDCMHVPFAFSGIRMSLKEISALLAVWPFLPYVSERNICIVGRLAVSFSFFF